MSLSSLVIPVLLAGVAVCGLGHRADVYGALTHGAEEGLTVLLRVIPALVGLLTAVSMFRASGAMDDLSSLCAGMCVRFTGKSYLSIVFFSDSALKSAPEN